MENAQSRAQCLLLICSLGLFLGSSCSGRRVSQEVSQGGPAPEGAPQSSPTSPAASLGTTPVSGNEKLLARVHELEAEVQRLQTGVSPSATRGVGESPEPELAATDPQKGFALDSSSKVFQRALTLYRAGQLGDCVAAFVQFVEDHPDHPLAGSALYYAGTAYLQQHEYKLAAETFQRVITSYDRSPRISHSLRALAEAQEALHQPQEATRTRALLSNLFPGSPANRGFATNDASDHVPDTAPVPTPAASDSKDLDTPPEGG